MTESQILDALNLGSSKEALANSPSSPLAQMLEVLAQRITDQLVSKTYDYNINASSNLSQSIKPTKVIEDSEGVSIAIEADYYWKFINYGVNGWLVQRGAPNWSGRDRSLEDTSQTWHQQTVSWMANRGITPREPDKTIDEVAYMIMSANARDGKEARPFFTDVVNERTIALMREPIEKLMNRAIKIRIIEPWQ